MIPPVCITGMHRSGTSMLALLLRACGLDLGGERNFAPVNPDNRLGFAEDLRFVDLNDRLLASAGGAWDRPPDPARIGRGLTGLLHRAAARRLLRRRSARHRATGHPWGWKDPRMALTMPFWQPLAPEMKVIICLRHPAEVARSLAVRTYGRSDEGEALWLAYNRRLLDAVPHDRRLIVANADVLANPARALAPVLDFIGLPREQAESAEVAALVRPDLQRKGAAAPLAASAEAQALYDAMLSAWATAQPLAQAHWKL